MEKIRTKFINAPEDITAELLEGYVLAYPDQVALAADNIVVRKNRRELVGVIHAVELGATDERDSVTNKLVMEVAVGIGGAICSNEQVRSVKIGSVHGYELDLNWPLRKLTDSRYACIGTARAVITLNCF